MASNNTNTKTKTTKFVVARGRFAIDGKAYEKGQVVELDDAQLKRVKLGNSIGNTLEPYKDDKKVVTPSTGNVDDDKTGTPAAPPAPPGGN